MMIHAKAQVAAAAAGLATVLACSAPTAVAADPLVLSDVRWVAEPAAGKQGAPRLRISHARSSSDQTLDGSRADFAAAEAELRRAAAGPVSFSIVHQSGTLSCTGDMRRAFDGDGRCRFTSDAGFEQRLAERGLAPGERASLLAMLLTGATIELADGLAGAGVRADDANDLIAAAALHLTPDYVRDINAGPLKLTALDDAFAYKALGIDGAYLRGLAEAGYTTLSPEEVMGMKATGVSPDYARAMNRAARGGQ